MLYAFTGYRCRIARRSGFLFRRLLLMLFLRHSPFRSMCLFPCLFPNFLLHLFAFFGRNFFCLCLCFFGDFFGDIFRDIFLRRFLF